MLRIYIADDHLLIREGLRKILSSENDISIVGETSDPYTALTYAIENKPDVLILDINFPGVNGLDILKKIKELSPLVNVLILSMHPEDKYALQVLKSGASGYISKDSVGEELIKAIRKAATGGKYVSPFLAEALAEAVETNKKKGTDILSEREFQVLIAIASGKPQIVIAKELSLSPNTINTYRIRILQKLNLKSNADIIHYALRNNLI